LAVPSGFFGCTIFGSFGARVPDTPGVPVYDFLKRSLPIAMCGLATVAMLPADVAPAVAVSRIKISNIRITVFIDIFVLIFQK
jgi:hypothetical protein